MAHHLARTSLLHEKACAFGGGGGGVVGHSAEIGFIIFQTEFKQKLQLLWTQYRTQPLPSALVTPLPQAT